MNNKNITTLALIALIALSIPLTLLILQTNNLDLNISAFESSVPENIIIADQTNSAFNVLWTTEKLVTGGLNAENIPLYEDSASRTHKIKVNVGKPNLIKEFNILSDGISYPEDNTKLNGKTSNVQPANNPSMLVFGQIINFDGISFLNEGFVTLKISKNGLESQLLSSLINEFGGYQIVFSNVLHKDLNNYFDYSGIVDIELTVYTSKNKLPVVKRFTQDITNYSQIPNIYLAEPEINLIPGIEGN